MRRYRALPLTIALAALALLGAAAALPPKKCCRAFSAECMSCVEGITEEEYCAKNPTVTGCGAPAF